MLKVLNHDNNNGNSNNNNNKEFSISFGLTQSYLYDTNNVKRFKFGCCLSAYSIMNESKYKCIALAIKQANLAKACQLI